MPVQLQEVARWSSQGLDPKVRRYINRMMSPLFGPIRKMMMLNYDNSSPSLYTFMPEMVDVHRRVGLNTTPQYHLGGFGFRLEEALLRALGETVERSSQMTFPKSFERNIASYSHEDLDRLGLSHLPLSELGRFSDAQRAQPGFLFQEVSRAQPVSWVDGIDLRDDKETLLPLQAVIVGHHSATEPRAALAVTTGTAAHVTYGKALSGAIRELLQIDATVGHWYSRSTAPRIELSPSSTPRLARFFERFSGWLHRAGLQIEFYWLQQPEALPLYIVACALRRPDGYPALSLGLGADAGLEEAMYSALYENAAKLFPARFDPVLVVGGPEIRRLVPPLAAEIEPERVGVELIRRTLLKHRLFMLDLTAADMATLGFKVVRLFSPDLLALCAPSFPEAAHPRFAAYGGCSSFEPHPYP
jgi:hypothetical protein